MVFKYDVASLIELVEVRPCLWDKTSETSKNKVLREKCWQEIFSFLETGYEEMSKDEKKNTGDSIVKKWSNVRDSFIKSLRTKTGQGFQKKYIYADNLNFLMKITNKAHTDSNLSETVPSQAISTSIPLTSPLPPNTPELPVSTPEPYELPPPVLSSRQKKKRREPDVIETEILAELQKRARNDTNIIPPPVHLRSDEKEIMLLSFLPYIKDMNETEMMDLHMKMLTSIQEIKKKRALNLRIYQSSSPSESSTHSSNNT